MRVTYHGIIKFGPVGNLSRRLRSYHCPSSAAGVGIDFERYPVGEPSSALLSEAIADARRSLAVTGCASFPGFFTAEATAAAASEAVSKAPDAFVTNSVHNAWQLPDDDPAYPSDHVRNLRMRTHVASIACDELALDGPLRRLYAYDPFVDFIRAVTSREALFRLADPLGACSINVFRTSWHHAWHFDESEYTTTLCLQQAEQGGDFEFTVPLRTSLSDLAIPAVAALISQRSEHKVLLAKGASGSMPTVPPVPPVATAPFEPGTLQVFAGRYSLHRVTPIGEGTTRDRMVAVLCFATRPGVINSPSVQTMFWGRSAQPSRSVR
jgi:hypothetical protein